MTKKKRKASLQCLVFWCFYPCWYRGVFFTVSAPYADFIHFMVCLNGVAVIFVGTLSGWWFQPLWKNISQLGLLFPIYGKVKNVPNHQPVMVMVLMLFYFGWSMTLSEMDQRSSLNIESPVVTHATKLHRKCDMSVVLSKPPKRIKKIEKEDPIKIIKSWYLTCPSFLGVDIVSMSAPPEGLHHSCLWPCYPHWRRVPWVSGEFLLDPQNYLVNSWVYGFYGESNYTSWLHGLYKCL